MEYMKPTINHVAKAIVAIQAGGKSQSGVDDPATGFETIPAYEADE
jgi:hypothetical protein